MSKSKVDFEPDGQEFECKEREWLIEYDGEQVGMLHKHTAWSGDAWTVTHYSVGLEHYPDDGNDVEEYRDFDVKGLWAGNGGYGGAFSNRRGHETSRKALAAAKRWTRQQLEIK